MRRRYSALSLQFGSEVSHPESSGTLASGWSPSDQPLVKEPEDSEYEIGKCTQVTQVEGPQ